MKFSRFPAFIFLFFCFSCRVMYKPNMQAVPLFQEKGEIRATVNLSNFQAAYAVTENIGVMANGYFQASSLQDPFADPEHSFSQRYLVEGGIGIFKKVNEESTAEIYGGGGFTNYSYEFSDLNPSPTYTRNIFSADAYRFFLQPNIGVSRKNIDFALSTRFAGLKYASITTNYVLDQYEEENIGNILFEPVFFFFEPAITFRAGNKWIKFHSQLQFSIKLTDTRLPYRSAGFNMGVHINIADRHNQTNENEGGAGLK